jgi:hypothetical protein
MGGYRKMKIAVFHNLPFGGAKGHSMVLSSI